MFSKYSVRKPYTVVVAVVLIIILGIVSFTHMTVDLLPSMNMPYAIVMTTYPGASPEEVETTVTKPIEQAMATVSNISNVSSTSRENASTVILEFEQTANMDSVTIEMRESLDQIKGYWPDTVANPIIMKLNPDMMPVMVAAINAGSDNVFESSTTIEKNILPEIESLEGVASVSTFGTVKQTVQVTIDKEKVDATNKKIKKALNGQFEEAQDKIDDGKAQIEQGKSELKSSEKQLESKMSQAAKAEAKILKGEQQIDTQMKKLEEGEQKLKEAKQSADKGKKQLDKKRQEALDAAYKKIETSMAGANAAIIKAAKKQVKEQVDKGFADGYAQITKGKKTIADNLKKLEAGKKKLQKAKKQLSSGKISLAQAQAKIEGAKIGATIQMAAANAQLAASETQLEEGEKELKDSKKAALEAANITKTVTTEMVGNLLTAENFSMPAGYVNEDGIDYLVRIGDKYKDIDGMEDMPLIDMDIDGLDTIRLSDVANVEYVNNADDTYAKINGEPGVLLTIQKQTGYSTGDVSKRLIDKFESLKKDNKEIDIVTLMDQGVYIDLIVNSVLQNMLFGAILAILILLLFLRDIRPTFIIALSIPISVIAALVLMYFSGVTLNIISLSGLALGIGMLVDNSIVVIENIYRMRNEEGKSAKESAIEGAKQVSGAIAASTLTTICVFAPIVFTEGITRQLFVDMGLTIAYSLLASLLIALTLVPMMAAGLLKKKEKQETKIFLKIREVYGKILAKALRLKPAVLLLALILFVGSMVLAASNGTAFMPDMESTEISMTLKTDKGTSIEDTGKVADDAMERLMKISDVEDVGAMVSTNSMTGQTESTNEVEIYAILKEKRELNSTKLQKRIEEDTKDLPCELNISMSNMDMSALGSSGVVVEIKGRDLDTLQTIAKDVSQIVKDTKGTTNVSDGMEETTGELRVKVNAAKAMKHNLTTAQIYQEISKKLSKASATTTLSTDLDDYDTFVVDKKNEELNRKDIKKLTITATKQDGTTEKVKLKNIAEFEDTVGLQSIYHDSQSRTLSVTAEVAEDDNIGIVSSRVREAMKKYDMPEGYSYEMTGEDETINESLVELLKMLGLAILFMYLIMVAQFQSLRSPFIVMFTVPLAFTGGFLGLYITHSPISVIAMIGFVMLSGIIVNNGIVFIDYTNQLIAGGMVQRDALVEAGRTRLRPIIMTALTTILGLSTMAIGVGMGADMVQPMAVVTIGGLLYGTLLTLFVVPCIFDLFHRREKSRLKDSIEKDDELIKDNDVKENSAGEEEEN